MVGETLYLLLLLVVVPLKGNKTGSCHPGSNKWVLNAYRWDTTRGTSVSDKSRRTPGTDDVSDGSWSGPQKAMRITLRSHLSLAQQDGRSAERVGKQGTGREEAA